MPRHEDRIGTLLAGKYRIEALLALGGMGLVYAARNEHTQRAVALKLLRSELSTRPDLVRRVSIEARLAVEAAHPNVVEVLDAGADAQGVPFVVTERLYGEPLESLIDAPLGVLPVAQAIVPVLNALVRLHAAGIIHRDLKPSNIFLSWTNGDRLTPKLLDFGIAKALAGSTATSSGIALGTPAYMAPEQALGAGAVAPTTDVWSIGVVLARCLTGKLPFEVTRGERFVALRQGLAPADLPGVPEPLGRVIAGALRFEPGERTRDIARFRSELLAALREIDAHASWPSETSVSYSEHECELARRLAINSAPVQPLPVSSENVPGRPAHVMTKTIDIETHTSARRSRSTARPSRLVRNVLAGVTVVMAGVTLFVARSDGWRRASSLAQSSGALLPAPSSVEPAPRVSVTASSEPTAPNGSVTAAPSVAAPSESTAPNGSVTATLSAVGTAKPPSKPKRKERQRARDDAARKPAPSERATSTLGANRSPIIE
jgi:eukaryotic-like serine/threonine-protein kinase